MHKVPVRFPKIRADSPSTWARRCRRKVIALRRYFINTHIRAYGVFQNFDKLKVCFIFFSIKITEDGKRALMDLSGGDMRKVLNVLQSTWLAFGSVSETNVYSCVGHPLPIDIKNILNWLLNEQYFSAYSSILFLYFYFSSKNKQGVSGYFYSTHPLI